MDVYTSDSSDSDSQEQKTLDYGNLGLTAECLDENLMHLHRINKLRDIETVLLGNNALSALPKHIFSRFSNLHVLDLSGNGLTRLPQDLIVQCPLTRLILKNNLLTNEALPKCLNAKASALKELNLSGNQLTHFPDNVLELRGLRYLYLGANKIKSISKDIWRLRRLVLQLTAIKKRRRRHENQITAQFIRFAFCRANETNTTIEKSLKSALDVPSIRIESLINVFVAVCGGTG